jgi:hypothetical protein
MVSKSRHPGPDRLEFDLDGDKVADVVIVDTNGHTVYVNIKWVLGLGVTLSTAVLAYVFA